MKQILDKKEFYKLLLKDRLPVAKLNFPTEKGNGYIEFIHTPLGVLLYICACGTRIVDIKMYDRNYGKIALQNIFCGENLVCIDDDCYISVSNKIKIEDVIGRSFLIKLEDVNIILRAEFVQRRIHDVDKIESMVYN